MKKSGLTEKNMANKRFRESEHAIFIAYYRFQDYPSAKKLAKRAGVSRSTVYYHHSIIQRIPFDYEQYLLRIYTKAINKLIKNDSINLRMIYLRTLVFISSNKEVIIALFKDGRKEVIKGILDAIKPRIINEWHLEGDMGKVYNIYKNEVLGCIEVWSKNRFSDSCLRSTLDDILYLTEVAYQKLLPIK